MTETVTIYGHEIELDEIETDSVITDVIVLYRTVQPADHSDGVGVLPSSNTTGIVQTGMLTLAAERDLHKWQTEEEDDD